MPGLTQRSCLQPTTSNTPIVTDTPPSGGSGQAGTKTPSTSTEGLVAGQTTRYWDCAKPSSAWAGKGPVSAPVKSCKADGVTPTSDSDADAFICTNQQPFEVSENLSYGFGAISFMGQGESDSTCGCFKVVFDEGTPVAGKTFIMQATNIGDLGSNHVDIAMPGGGFGQVNRCTTQWSIPATAWGPQANQNRGGLTSNTCKDLPKALQPGCEWRFGWFNNADNPSMKMARVQCPAELTKISGCKRTDDSKFPAA